jgi:competence protein ComEC
MADNLLVIIDLPLRLFFKIAVLFSHIYRFTIFRASPHLFLVILIVALFYLFPVFTDSKKKLHKIFLFVAIFIFIIATLFIILDPLSYKPDRLEVFYLDVGQGDSQVVVFPGGDALLIDGGGAYYSDFETGKQILLPFLLQKRIKIKWVAVSHFHPDHVRGIIEIIEVIKPEELWLSSAAQNDMYYKSLMERVKDVASIEIKKLDSTFLKTIGGCKVECLFPGAFIETRYSHNNHSQVLKVSDGGNSFLFTGDIEKEVEEILVQDSCPRLKADVLKVPHHGSKTSSSTFFLRCAAPGLAIYSYSKNNRFNFPHPQVVENYKAQRVRTLAVASRGGIKITSLPGGIEIETSK